MPSLNASSASDIDLVKVIRSRASIDRQTAALKELEHRCMPAFRAVRSMIHDVPGFLRQAGALAIEDVEAEAMARAIDTYKSGQGTRFSSYAGKVLHNLIADIFRSRKRPQVSIDAGRRVPAAPAELGLEQGVLQKAADLARACLSELDDRKRDVFVWSALFDCTPTMLHEIFPDISTANFKQLKHRALADFVELWRSKDGAQLLGMVQEVGRAMAERVDLSRIKDGKSRRALELWRERKSVSAVAKHLKMKEVEARQLLLDALKALAGAAMKRQALAEYLQLAEDGGVKDEITLEIGRTLALVRAAFGLGPVEAAIDTLGSYLQRRLSGPDDYERAGRELELKPAGLRRLLADEADVDAPLLGRLSRFLDMPQDRLSKFPRRPAAVGSPALRGTSRFDVERFRARVLECLKKR